MNFFKKLLLPLALLCSMAVPALAQYGVQPTEATAGEVSLDNLNVHLDLPILGKAGLIPFSVSETYNSNAFVLATNPDDTQTWAVPIGAWSDASGFGFVSWGTKNCNDAKNTRLKEYTAYTDGRGGRHVLGTGVMQNGLILHAGGGIIGTNCATSDHFNFHVTDGSGLIVNLYSDSTPWTAVSRNGLSVTILPPYTGNGQTMTSVDGNTVSYATNPAYPYAKVFTDSLGVQELTVDAVTNPLAITYTYPTSTGTAQVVVNLQAFTIKTNFGCVGVAEVNYSDNLPVSISLPDGSS